MGPHDTLTGGQMDQEHDADGLLHAQQYLEKQQHLEGIGHQQARPPIGQGAGARKFLAPKTKAFPELAQQIHTASRRNSQCCSVEAALSNR